MMIFAAFSGTFVALVKAALATFGFVAAVLLFMFLLVSLIWLAIEVACQSFAAEKARA